LTAVHDAHYNCRAAKANAEVSAEVSA